MHTTDKKFQKGKENEEEKKYLGRRLINEWKDWLEDFTMHGFKNIMKAEYPATRFVWILFTMGMIVYSIYCK